MRNFIILIFAFNSFVLASDPSGFQKRQLRSVLESSLSIIQTPYKMATFNRANKKHTLTTKVQSILASNGIEETSKKKYY